MKIFISYSHQQKDWVRKRLAPCLVAGGAEVLIDEAQLRVGARVLGQLDALQDGADASLLCFTPEYLASPYCRHEMDRAILRDQFVPVKLADCAVPTAEHLHADLREEAANEWDKMLLACGADLGCEAPHWLSVRDDVRRDLGRGVSVNLVVSGKPVWRELLKALELPNLRQINLDNGKTADRPGLVREILRAHGDQRPVPDEPKDIGLLSEFLEQRKPALAFLRFDHVLHRPYQVDFFANLRFHLEERNLTMLIESTAPFASLLPPEHKLSSLASIAQVELRGR